MQRLHCNLGPLLVLLAVAVPLPAQQTDDNREPFQRPQRVGKLPSKLIPEASGVVRSRRHANILWTHNDSGGAAEVFAVLADGTIVRRLTIPMATNVDWEDIALDGSNRLIVADIGDNQAARQELVLYRFPEPDPEGAEAVGDVETLRVRYPPKLGPVDAEALFLCGNHAFLVTKERRTARVFRIALPSSGQATTAPIVAESLGALQGIGHATAACLSDDGRHLALLTYFEIVVLDFDKALAPDLPALELLTTLGKAPRRRQSIFLGQSEGITFDGLTLIIAAEMGPFPGGQATLWRLTPK